jgi:molybdate transport system ATP-binding protein
MLSVAAAKQRGAFRLDVRFELPTPGVVALFGPSGCGKTTAVNLIAGLLRPDRGRVALDDSVLFDSERGVDVPVEKRGIGYVFQDARLFPHLSVAGNLKFAERRAARAGSIGFDRVAGMLELQPLMARRVHQLSGGEKQRVAIGRALLSQPRLLLLDEPLASLDRERREEVLPYLETLRDQLALPMVYVSHQFDEVLRLATHIVLMQSGTVAAQGGIGAMSLDRRLRAMIGPDAVGAVVDGTVIGSEPAGGLLRLRIGDGEIRVNAASSPPGTTLRVQLLARDIIVATRRPELLSVRNHLKGVVTAVEDDGASDLISIGVGGAGGYGNGDDGGDGSGGSDSGGSGPTILARITQAATRELALVPGKPVWVLVKSVSLRGLTSPGFPDG